MSKKNSLASIPVVTLAVVGIAVVSLGCVTIGNTHKTEEEGEVVEKYILAEDGSILTTEAGDSLTR